MKARAKIKGSPFEVEVEPFYIKMHNYDSGGRYPINYMRFHGFADQEQNIYAPEELEFLPPKPAMPDASVRLMDSGLDARAMNRLRWAFADWNPKRDWEDIRVADLAEHTRMEYIKLRNLGKKSLYAMEVLMKKYGLKFKGEE